MYVHEDTTKMRIPYLAAHQLCQGSPYLPGLVRVVHLILTYLQEVTGACSWQLTFPPLLPFLLISIIAACMPAGDCAQVLPEALLALHKWQDPGRAYAASRAHNQPSWGCSSLRNTPNAWAHTSLLWPCPVQRFPVNIVISQLLVTLVGHRRLSPAHGEQAQSLMLLKTATGARKTTWVLTTCTACGVTLSLWWKPKYPSWVMEQILPIVGHSV